MAMTNEELIRQLAEPILEQLIAMEENSWTADGQPPVVHLTIDESSEAADSDFYEQLIRDVEKYVQEELENWFKPSILH